MKRKKSGKEKLIQIQRVKTVGGMVLVTIAAIKHKDKYKVGSRTKTVNTI